MAKYMTRQERIDHWKKDNKLLEANLKRLEEKYKDEPLGWPFGDKLLASKISREIVKNNKRIEDREAILEQ